jgi:hypothetical protein
MEKTKRPYSVMIKNGRETDSGNNKLEVCAIGSDIPPILISRQGDILEFGQISKWIIQQDNQLLIVHEHQHQRVYEDGVAENEYTTEVFQVHQIFTNKHGETDLLPCGYEEDVCDFPEDPKYSCPHCGESFRFSTWAEYNTKKMFCVLCGNPFRMPTLEERLEI